MNGKKKKERCDVKWTINMTSNVRRIVTHVGKKPRIFHKKNKEVYIYRELTN